MRPTNGTLTDDERDAFYKRTTFFARLLPEVLYSFSHWEVSTLTPKLTDKLTSIGNIVLPVWKENTNINKWALEIKQAAQSLIDQAKELNPDNGLFKGDQSPSGTDHDRVLYLWKLYFATFLLQHLYGRLRFLEITEDGVEVLESLVEHVTAFDCYEMSGQIENMVNQILDAVKDPEASSGDFEDSTDTVVDPVLVVQKIRTYITGQQVNIIASVKAIAFDVDGKAVNLVNCINNLGSLFCPE
ncbi:hypothetical protein H4219_003632 [Mycoemilia scoparia]|uniref:Uncharacterized protein n=1 Tax=Mycoemilia scoparia TaxID=417184 RepID=A0A9W8DNZ3_9FUNG|nr:hypothetical protein H4219_003632 [Mycoemilia scoparia]